MDFSHYLIEAASFDVSSRAFFSLPEGIIDETPYSHQSLKACLAYNYFYDVPKELNQMPFLEHINISHNLLKSLNQLPNFYFLKYINLSHNDLTSFNEIFEIRALTALDLSYNKISYIPGNISKLNSLIEVNFEGNIINDIDSKFTHLSNLKLANFSRNKIKTLPKNIDRLKNLKIFNISVNRISELPIELGTIESLEVLETSQNPLIFPPSNINILGSSYIKAFLRIEFENLKKKIPPKSRALRSTSVDSNFLKDKIFEKKTGIIAPPIPCTDTLNSKIAFLKCRISLMSGLKFPNNLTFFEFISDGIVLGKIIEKYSGVKDFGIFIPEQTGEELSHDLKRKNIQKIINFCEENISKNISVCKTFQLLSGMQDDEVLNTIKGLLDYLISLPKFR